MSCGWSPVHYTQERLVRSREDARLRTRQISSDGHRRAHSAVTKVTRGVPPSGARSSISASMRNGQRVEIALADSPDTPGRLVARPRPPAWLEKLGAPVVQTLRFRST